MEMFGRLLGELQWENGDGYDHSTVYTYMDYFEE